jgi:uncharacterized protein YkwD
MRRSTLYACTAALALTAIAPVAHADPLQGPDSLSGPSRVVRVRELESGLVAAINVVRAQRGLRPFRSSPGLRAAAAAHSSDMARRGYFDHEAPGGGPFWRRIGRFYGARGFRQWEVGENIAYGSPTLDVQEALRVWLASPPHRATLLSRSWRQAGIGAVYSASAPGIYGGAPATIVTLDVGRRRR